MSIKLTWGELKRRADDFGIADSDIIDDTTLSDIYIEELVIERIVTTEEIPNEVHFRSVNK